MIEALVISCTLVLFRNAAFVAFLPPVAGKSIPKTVKVGLAVAPRFAGVTAMQLQVSSTGAGVWLQIGWLAARETAVGASLAWLFGLCLVPGRIAGAYIAQEMGLTMAQLTSATDDQQSNVVSQGFEALGVLLFFGLNLHHAMFMMLGSSFATRPIVGAWSLPTWDTVMYSISKVEHQGFLMIAPIGILMFVISITMLITMRTAPQFNFMTYGMTLRLVVGLAGLFLFLPDVFTAMEHFLNQITSESWVHG
ncbi:MAG: flagellar biosynthetic protein FliR [Fuerstiella sp.]|nr:flagellar biosynthetic protein FliR [Fuerstiella sp.]MCP4857374.1 flagellar biosynthetic protein FliR [Fuerstiella sp.]